MNEGMFSKYYRRKLLSIFYPGLLKTQITRNNETEEETSIIIQKSIIKKTLLI